MTNAFPDRREAPYGCWDILCDGARGFGEPIDRPDGLQACPVCGGLYIYKTGVGDVNTGYDGDARYGGEF